MTRVLAAASSASARRGLEALLQGLPSVEPVGATSPGLDLARRLRETGADLLLLELGPEDPLALLESLEASPAVVLLVDAPGSLPLADLLRLGVRGLLRRDAQEAEVGAAVAAAALGLLVLHPDAMPSTGRRRTVGAPAGEGLTARESEVLEMMAQGLANKEIAARLGISENTVKFHLASMYGKLGVSSRTEAVTAALRTGRLML